jgi:hypothetical protein
MLRLTENKTDSTYILWYSRASCAALAGAAQLKARIARRGDDLTQCIQDSRLPAVSPGLPTSSAPLSKR